MKDYTQLAYVVRFEEEDEDGKLVEGFQRMELRSPARGARNRASSAPGSRLGATLDTTPPRLQDALAALQEKVAAGAEAVRENLADRFLPTALADAMSIFDPLYHAADPEPSVENFVAKVNVLAEYYGKDKYLADGKVVPALVSPMDLRSEQGFFRRAMRMVSRNINNEHRAKEMAAAAFAAASATVTAPGDEDAGETAEAANASGEPRLNLRVADVFKEFELKGLLAEFPSFAKLAKVYLTLVVTSVKDECTFSSAAFILDERRNSMSSKRLDQWMRLYLQSKWMYKKLEDFPFDRALVHWDQACEGRMVAKTSQNYFFFLIISSLVPSEPS